MSVKVQNVYIDGEYRLPEHQRRYIAFLDLGSCYTERVLGPYCNYKNKQEAFKAAKEKFENEI